MTSSGPEGSATQTAPAPATVVDAFATLASAIENFEVREAQLRLALAIETAMQNQTGLAAEAGCGVGKSFGGLLPAILTGQRVVYATATKALQDQLANKDLPFLASVFPGQFTYAVLKGRGNYVCHARLEEHPDAFVRGAVAKAMAEEDFDGEFDSLSSDLVEPSDRIKLTISGDECPGKKNCPFGQVCMAERARERASKATITVVNHSLLATDARIGAMTGGNVSMIGPYEHLIVDEAHELEEFVSGALATTVRRGTIERLVTELHNYGVRLNVATESIEDDLSLAVGALFDFLEPGRLRRKMIFNNSVWFENLYHALNRVGEWLTSSDVADAIHDAPQMDRDRLRLTRDRLQRRSGNLTACLYSVMADEDHETVRFVEEEFRPRQNDKIKVLTVTPVRVSGWLKANLWNRVSPVVMSATLAVGKRFDYIIDRLGLDTSIPTLDAGSPFDFGRQARLYVPAHLPTPSGKTAAQWGVEYIDEMNRLVHISQGRALLLFTSRKEMDLAWTALQRIFEASGYPCRKQNQGSNASLLEWFKGERHSVLFALRSFFTGIDVQGDSLSLVVINKLPFPVPTEPVFEARAEEIKRRGGNDFSELTVPMMTLPLQQAAGRLIRTIKDTGVVAILDERILSKGYGKTIQRSLPPMSLVTRISGVEEFFSSVAGA